MTGVAKTPRIHSAGEVAFPCNFQLAARLLQCVEDFICSLLVDVNLDLALITESLLHFGCWSKLGCNPFVSLVRSSYYQPRTVSLDRLLFRLPNLRACKGLSFYGMRRT
ncbi:hypothetical protein MPTK1_2g20440 [Marchantia polymorpha subsp. ruderalis]|uniref:Uncharacterized protein n=1 Tax=Marchantia polymorpha TaxID=3197 RepID=A0A2R6WV50_MARPO|nr:hypothetical protein MARPO_0055s0005 [Marchantia polymorpha]BBN03069.1 hypothetical protein Mp_2g20440 [Marchantia polymorpha subsp. ruderalis]|eukprot:PTQ37716.1 hypothetical protein MARPO_0055s0005 [Marchantia polymorpha]